VRCWMRPGQPTTITPPLADRVKLSGSATGSAASRTEGWTADPNLGVGADGRRLTEPVKTARHRLGGPKWRPPSGGVAASLMYLLDPDLVGRRQVGIVVGAVYI
jgi:hypothetical protein